MPKAKRSGRVAAPAIGLFTPAGAIPTTPNSRLMRLPAAGREAANAIDVGPAGLHQRGGPQREATEYFGGALSFLATPKIVGGRLFDAFAVCRR